MNGLELSQAMRRKNLSNRATADLLSVTTKDISKWIRNGVPKEYEQSVRKALCIPDRKSDCLQKAMKTSSGARFGQ